MAWYEILMTVVGGLGGVTGITSAVVLFYKAKPEKTALEIQNFVKLLDEAQEEREKLKEDDRAFREETDKKIHDLNQKIDELRRSDNRKMRAINSAYRCKFPESLSQCPVLNILDLSCKADEGLTK